MRLVILYIIVFSYKTKQSNKDALISFLDDFGKKVVQNLEKIIGDDALTKKSGGIFIIFNILNAFCINIITCTST